MLDKHLHVNKHYYKVKDCKPIHIKILGDLHHYDSFDNIKLEKIAEELQQTPTDYVCIAGDLIDSTKYLYTNSEKKEKLLEWLRKICSQYKTFLTFGNHDFTFYQGLKRTKDENKEFFQELASIPGLHVSHYQPYYEDDSVIIYQLELNYDYYYHDNGFENVDVLIEVLEEQKEQMQNLDKEKIKILMVHSPQRMTNPKVLEYVKEFDFIISGHMHNGLVPTFLTNLLPGTRGLISPYKKPFAKHARGVETIHIGDKEIKMIITGGITKLQNCAPFRLRKLNHFYPMQMDEIIINDESHYKRRNKTL